MEIEGYSTFMKSSNNQMQEHKFKCKILKIEKM